MDAFEEPGTLPYFVRAVKAMREAQTDWFTKKDAVTQRRAKELTRRVDAFILDYELKLQNRQLSLLPKKEHVNEPD
jgi:hypothetical protein